MNFYKTLKNERITSLPMETRLEAYNEVSNLKNKNLKPFEIFRLFNKRGLNIKYETIRRWYNNMMSPYNKINPIKDFKEDLAEVIGLIIGDGTKHKVIKNNSYNTGRINFGVKDKDLAERFAFLLSKVLGKNKPYSMYFSNYNNVYMVQGNSKLLVELLLKPIDNLKPIIERYPSNFLKGIFDAEGCVNIKKIKNNRIYLRIFLTNSNLGLIKYIRGLLKNRFGIDSRIDINTYGGKYKFIKDKYTLTRNDCYNLCIGRLESVKRFNKFIGFNTIRKRNKLNKMVEFINNYGTKGAFKTLYNN